jgi:hypothetical protein
MYKYLIISGQNYCIMLVKVFLIIVLKFMMYFLFKKLNNYI